jgi:hypothetical protein
LQDNCVRHGGAWECRQNRDVSLITEGDPDPQAFSEVVYQQAGRPAKKITAAAVGGTAFGSHMTRIVLSGTSM